jgi:antirestriction protein ArdC
MSHLDVYQTVTNQIIAALEAGTPPWHCPWHTAGVDPRPCNATTGRMYRGINVLLLNMRAMACGYSHSRWLTFAQAQAVGARVRKGEHGSQVVFFKLHEVDGAGQPDAAGDPDRRVVPLLRAFTVFNIDQVDGLPEGLAPAPLEPGSWEPLDAAEAILERSGALLRHGGSKAFYAPDADLIQMPPQAAFSTAEGYYSTALHELTHWTAHPSRCNRLLGRRHGIDAYAFEELVAEMGASFLTSFCGIEAHLQHASYIASWLQALRNDRRLIFTAAAQAQKAADFLLADDQVKPAASAAAEALVA